VGGGIRAIETAKKLLDGGVERIILGSMPIKEPESAKKLLDTYGSDRIVIALDHKNGNLMVQGWQESTKRRLGESLEGFTRQGYEWFLVTDINQDGTLEGPDCRTYTEISRSGRIIASGGVGSLQDIERLKKTGVQATVIGKALYLNQFTLEEAMEAAKC
jgi:phosphoribosylformimino-5-aminoimidazole carboxamide ribotide isomerase